jgi:hypothetical protein
MRRRVVVRIEESTLHRAMQWGLNNHVPQHKRIQQLVRKGLAACRPKRAEKPKVQSWVKEAADRAEARSREQKARMMR